MKQFTLDQLSQGIRERHIGAERARLTEKWSRTGLLRGLDGNKREVMSQLLENQAAQVLKESNTMSGGGVQGFSNIAFPIVRRVFGGLVANELVSIQPMSLPSGLIFYLDYTYGSSRSMDGSDDAVYTKGQSIYNSPTGKGVRSGSLATGGMYDLVGTGYSRVTGSLTGSTYADGYAVGAWGGVDGLTWADSLTVKSSAMFSGSNARFCDFDSQVETALSLDDLDLAFLLVPISGSSFDAMDKTAVDQLAVFGTGGAGGRGGPVNAATAWGETYQGGKGVLNLRRLNKRGNWNGSVFTPDALNGTHVLAVVKGANAAALTLGNSVQASFVKTTSLTVDSGSGSTLTIPSFESDFGATPAPAIPEIDIKIESIAITAETRKLRARWSPELAQDLNAYHSMDAEVELTSILSEQIALEIDREILNDLVTQANGANYYWSRAPGRFVNKTTGVPVGLSSSLSIGPAFTGTVREWYETFIETIIDVANTIHRKTLRGSANFMVCGPDVATILESSVLYKPKFSMDGEGQVGSPFTIGAESIGTLSNRFTVYKDPYFVRNKVLVGYKGGSYLETGYVYAPYVPLIVTPTIFAPEDFTPRKGVMTRYGKKMVRSDFYGTVTVLDMNII